MIVFGMLNALIVSQLSQFSTQLVALGAAFFVIGLIALVIVSMPQFISMGWATIIITFGVTMSLMMFAIATPSTYRAELAGIVLVIAIGGLLFKPRTLALLTAFCVALLVVFYMANLRLVMSPGQLSDLQSHLFIYACLYTTAAFISAIYGQRRRTIIETVQANEALLAMQNKSLAQEVTDRRTAEHDAATRSRELATLLQISNTISSTLELSPLLRSISEHMRGIMHFDTITMTELHPDSKMQSIYADGPQTYRDKLHETSWTYDPARDTDVTQLLQTKATVLTSDLNENDAIATGKRKRMLEFFGHLPVYATAYIAAPLIVRERVIGYICFTSRTRGQYTAADDPLIMGFANLVAASVEKANLYEKSIEAAALHERSRIARELHDSVSQALFGIVLGSKTLIHSYDTTHAPVPEAATYVLNLAEAALAETRALVFEMRPEYLEIEGLQAALKKQVDTLCARHQINATVELMNNEPNLPLKTKEALYRIALEAIQNIIKHAQATQVLISLVECDGVFEMSIADNGKGITTTGSVANRFGLKTMRERAKQLDAHFVIDSAAETGTRITITLPLGQIRDSVSPAVSDTPIAAGA